MEKKKRRRKSWEEEETVPHGECVAAWANQRWVAVDR